MEFSDVVSKRRAVRSYEQQRLDRTVVKKLIDVAVLAPSAMNVQPWAFVVVLGRDKVDAYARRAKEWLLANPDALPAEGGLRDFISDPQLTLFYGAAALVVVLAKSGTGQASEDCCLAAQNLLLAARDAGIGTCWIGLARPWLDLPQTKAELNIPGQYRVVAPIVLGYPQAWPESHGRKAAETIWIE
jgi:nitroreductase